VAAAVGVVKDTQFRLAEVVQAAIKSRARRVDRAVLPALVLVERAARHRRVLVAMVAQEVLGA
jgi:hypothetical protein